MIDDGDHIAVAVSGGKDSMLMLKALAAFRGFSPQKFSLTAIAVDLGFGADFTPLEEFCRGIDVDLKIVPTHIGEVIFKERREKNPCALCSKMKRGALVNAAVASGCNKLALGHHADDLIETFLMEMLYNGKVNTFSPVTLLDVKNITVIRPLIYLREKETIYAANRLSIPVIDSLCPADGATKREEMKELVKSLTRKIPEADERIIHAVMGYVGKK